MKILVANKMDWTHPNMGGAEKNLEEILPRLVERGHDVHLLCAYYPGAERNETLKGVDIHRYGLENSKNELYILSAGQIHLNMLIYRLDPDVLYTVNSLMTWLPAMKRGNHVTRIHHLNSKTLLNERRFPLNYIGYAAEKLGLLISRRRRVISVSQATTLDLVKNGIQKQNIVEIKNGVDKEKFRSGEKNSEPTVLYLGRLEHSKGADLLPEIHRSIEKKFGNYRLEIAGKGRESEELKNFADQNPSVTFHGWVDEEKKKKLLSSAWTTIVPSRREGWGLVVNEANASGTPAVGFNVGGLKHSIKDEETGLIVPFDETQECIEKLGKAVATLLSKDKLRTDMSGRARTLAEERNWEDSVEKLETVLEKTST